MMFLFLLRLWIAPQRSIQSILDQASYYRSCGADIIDLGFLSGESFGQLEETIQALKAEGYRVSVDSLEPKDLIRAGKAGADYLLSLAEETLDVANEVDSTPILIPAIRGNLASLERAMERMDRWRRPWLADPILEPIHFGFIDSLVRYHELRSRYPEVSILMGVGNLTELTDADTTGINAILFGIISELAIHIKDPSYCIRTSEAGIHIFNREGIHCAQDPFALFPHFAIEGDAGHAFYLGVELARAQIAWQLGKRYNQDEELNWGCAYKQEPEDLSQQKGPGTTLQNPKRSKGGGRT